MGRSLKKEVFAYFTARLVTSLPSLRSHIVLRSSLLFYVGLYWYCTKLYYYSDFTLPGDKWKENSRAVINILSAKTDNGTMHLMRPVLLSPTKHDSTNTVVFHAVLFRWWVLLSLVSVTVVGECCCGWWVLLSLVSVIVVGECVKVIFLCKGSTSQAGSLQCRNQHGSTTFKKFADLVTLL